MNTDDHSTRHEDGVATSPSSVQNNEDLRKLEKRLEELRGQCILIGGDGPRKTLRPVDRVHGGLDRFLAERE